MVTIDSVCPHCQANLTLSEKLVADNITCPKCDQPFVVTEVRRHKLAYQPPPGPAARELPARHSLTLPPPPRERWTGRNSDEPEPLFQDFRPSSREVRDFLDRHNVSDHSWLLVAGLLLSTLLVLAFMSFLVYLILK